MTNVDNTIKTKLDPLFVEEINGLWNQIDELDTSIKMSDLKYQITKRFVNAGWYNEQGIFTNEVLRIEWRHGHWYSY